MMRTKPAMIQRPDTVLTTGSVYTNHSIKVNVLPDGTFLSGFARTR